MYILNIRSVTKMTLKELKVFIFENYYRQNGFSKENSYYSMKHQKKKDFPVFANKLMKKKNNLMLIGTIHL